MILKKGDFIAIDFVGKIQETGKIFDLTDERLAKKENIHDPKVTYGAKIICIGQGQIVRGLDVFLEGKELNKEYTVELTAEEAFGKKDARLLKLVPFSLFKKQNIKPFPGLQLNIDGKLGIVRTVSGGRIIVDFNHPLAGRKVLYTLTVKRLVKDMQEQLDSYLTTLFHQKVPCVAKEGKATLTVEVPEHLQKPLQEQLQKVIPGLKSITFKTDKAAKKETTTKA